MKMKFVAMCAPMYSQRLPLLRHGSDGLLCCCWCCPAGLSSPSCPSPCYQAQTQPTSSCLVLSQKHQRVEMAIFGERALEVVISALASVCDLCGHCSCALHDDRATENAHCSNCDEVVVWSLDGVSFCLVSGSGSWFDRSLEMGVEVRVGRRDWKEPRCQPFGSVCGSRHHHADDVLVVGIWSHDAVVCDRSRDRSVHLCLYDRYARDLGCDRFPSHALAPRSGVLWLLRVRALR